MITDGYTVMARFTDLTVSGVEDGDFSLTADMIHEIGEKGYVSAEFLQKQVFVFSNCPGASTHN